MTTIVIGSNAGGETFDLSQGNLVQRRAAGGLVTAINGLQSFLPSYTWVRVPATQAEFEIIQGQRRQPPPTGNVKHVIAKGISQQERDDFYGFVSNGWLVHVLLYQPGLAAQSLRDPRLNDAWNNFKNVSQAIANTVVDEISQSDPGDNVGVWIEDYHMVLVPAYIRDLLKTRGLKNQVAIQTFIHTTWASPDYWQSVPQPWRLAIARGVLGGDSLGFQSPVDVQNFTECVRQWIPQREVKISQRQPVIQYQNRLIVPESWPIGIDTAEFQSRLNSAGGQQAIMDIDAKIAGRQFVVAGIGRTDPTKKLDVLLLAFEAWLDAHPAQVQDSVLLLHLTPSRLILKVYQDHDTVLNNESQRINNKFRKLAGGRDVVEMYYKNDAFLLLGLYYSYDVLAVPSEADGFALTAGEGPLLNNKHGVLILSTRTGAYSLLSQGCLAFTPNTRNEVRQLADLIDQASNLGTSDRTAMQVFLRLQIHSNNLAMWLGKRMTATARVLNSLP